MDITQKFLAFTLLGAEWVLWLLVALSVVSVGVMIERLLFFAGRKIDREALAKDVRAALAGGGVEAAVRKYEAHPALEAAVAVAGLREAVRGHAVAAESMVGVKVQGRQLLEKNLAFLGTLGNNAPFIGLFGTVLGIIKAFHDLAENSQAGAQAVMSGISEALVATAIGLLVAIPAVLAFNYFNRRVRAVLAHADALAHAILADLRAAAPADKRAEAA